MPIYRFDEPLVGHTQVREWRRRGRLVLGLLGALIAFTAIGLTLLDDPSKPLAQRLLQGLWNAVNLITTLGDFSSFDARQKVFMLVSMLSVAILGGYALSELTGLLSSPSVAAYRENRRMTQNLDTLSEHVIVLGFKGLGRRLANDLREASQGVVVIERDADAATAASGKGYLVVHGDAASGDEVLRAARIDTAAALLITSSDPNRCLALTLIAHTLSPRLRIIASAEDDRWAEMLRRAGASETVVANRLLSEAILGQLGASRSGG